MARSRDLTRGNITAGLWSFAIPLMFGNVLQQLYNLVDTWVVGRYLGEGALAAVGSSYTLMTFLTSIIIGMCLAAVPFYPWHMAKRMRTPCEMVCSCPFFSLLFWAAIPIGWFLADATGILYYVYSRRKEQA